MKRDIFINEELTRLKNQQNQLVKLLELPESQLRLAPRDSWSAGECIHHMLLASRPYIDRIEKKLATAKKSTNQNFKRGILGAYFTFGMLPKPDGEIKNRMKTMYWFDPGKSGRYPEYDALQPHELVRELDEVLQRTSQALQKAKSLNLNTNKITSTLGPIVRFKLGDAFAFMNAHNERHLLQTRRIIDSVIPSEEKA
jgi:hypothetical protein